MYIFVYPITDSEHGIKQFIPHDYIPDVRDGLTRIERVVLKCIYDLEKESNGRMVPTILLWGELIDRGYDISRDDLNKILSKLGGMDKSWTEE